MCGIVGTFGTNTLSWAEKQLAQNLFWLDTIRGKDSSGACFIDLGGRAQWFKSVGTPVKLEDELEYVNRWKTGLRGFIGHNRAATVGKVNVENAHPFHCKHIIGVHNGTLTYDGDLEKVRHDAIDSERIFASIADRGIDWTWARIHGAATLVWYDCRNQSINIITNGKRPFSYAFTSGERFFFASEGWMIEKLVYRKLTNADKDLKLNHPRVDVHYSIKIGKKNKLAWSSRKLDPPTYKRQAAQSYYRSGKDWLEEEDDVFGTHYVPSWDRHWKPQHQKNQKPLFPNRDNSDRKEYADRLKNWFGKNGNSGATENDDNKVTMKNGMEITREEYDKSTKDCMWCAEAVGWGDAVIYDADSVVCSECYEIGVELGLCA